MDFGEAFALMQKGAAVRREKWWPRASLKVVDGDVRCFLGAYDIPHRNSVDVKDLSADDWVRA